MRTPDDPAYPHDAALTAGDLDALDGAVVDCRACPRLVAWREHVATVKRAAFRDETYWARPAPGFGDPAARVLVVGLAPAAHGANRTGRMFTGDRSGDVLFAALHRAGMASQPTSTHRDDGLRLTGVRITAPVHCAPPDNRPLPEERHRCGPWLARELELVQPRVVVVLGGFGWDALLRTLAEQGWTVPRPAPPVRARRAGRAPAPRRRGPDPAGLLPRQPAEHLHGPPDPRDARRRARARPDARGVTAARRPGRPRPGHTRRTGPTHRLP